MQHTQAPAAPVYVTNSKKARKKKWLIALATTTLTITGASMFLSSINATLPENTDTMEHSKQYHQGKFHNQSVITKPSNSEGSSILKRWLFEKKVDASPTQEMPIVAITPDVLTQLPNNTVEVFRLGHSSILLKLHGDFWLLDPVFADRASPFSFIGPKRFHQTPISIDDLPDLKGVIISHNHYDHLDKNSVKQLADKVDHFWVPLGVDGDLQHWGVNPDKITAMDWWQEAQVGDVTLAFTPTQHFSGRGLSDGNKTLWGSWVIKSQDQSLYFSGDSGYFDGFKQIGEKYGPFDLTMIETGAYDPSWPGVHMMPEQSIQAHLDLQGKQMLPIHNSTFDLAFHRWYDPLETIQDLATQHQVNLLTPKIGAQLTVTKHAQTEKNHTTPWWRGLNEK